MTRSFCSYEDRIAAAARSGDWPSHLAEHAAGCSSCAETRAAASFMRRVAEGLGRADALPEPSLLWLKAALERRHEAVRRRTRRRALVQGVLGLGLALAGSAMFPALWPLLVHYAQAFAATGFALALTLVIVYFAGLGHARS